MSIHDARGLTYQEVSRGIEKQSQDFGLRGDGHKPTTLTAPAFKDSWKAPALAVLAFCTLVGGAYGAYHVFHHPFAKMGSFGSTAIVGGGTLIATAIFSGLFFKKRKLSARDAYLLVDEHKYILIEIIGDMRNPHGRASGTESPTWSMAESQ